MHEQVVQTVNSVDIAQQLPQLAEGTTVGGRDRRGLVVPKRRTSGADQTHRGGQPPNDQRIPCRRQPREPASANRRPFALYLTGAEGVPHRAGPGRCSPDTYPVDEHGRRISRQGGIATARTTNRKVEDRRHREAEVVERPPPIDRSRWNAEVGVRVVDVVPPESEPALTPVDSPVVPPGLDQPGDRFPRSSRKSIPGCRRLTPRRCCLARTIRRRCHGRACLAGRGGSPRR